MLILTTDNAIINFENVTYIASSENGTYVHFDNGEWVETIDNVQAFTQALKVLTTSPAV